MQKVLWPNHYSCSLITLTVPPLLVIDGNEPLAVHAISVQLPAVSAIAWLIPQSASTMVPLQSDVPSLHNMDVEISRRRIARELRGQTGLICRHARRRRYSA